MSGLTLLPPQGESSAHFFDRDLRRRLLRYSDSGRYPHRAPHSRLLEVGPLLASSAARRRDTSLLSSVLRTRWISSTIGPTHSNPPLGHNGVTLAVSVASINAFIATSPARLVQPSAPATALITAPVTTPVTVPVNAPVTAPVRPPVTATRSQASNCTPQLRTQRSTHNEPTASFHSLVDSAPVWGLCLDLDLDS